MNSPAATSGYQQKQETSVEVYGFVSFLLSHVVFVIYLIWAFIPDKVLEQYGITHYPTKYWAAAVPAWAWILFPNYFCSSFSIIALSKIPDSTSAQNFEDSHTLHPITNHVNGALPALSDIPMAVAQQLLYSPDALHNLYDEDEPDHQNEHASFQ
eukprot:Blabericola_migrator_1__11442@NODE_67_length_15652_cov_76_134937_g60_i0_p11_GENE_NODE_67_length_15652_cov_76_134937_g60_i0NODE_67_length_15652_cov_76_134937_g60_i0_p11_ORF_typecomplete_len155_score23_92PIGP/PF08510_12/2_1e24DUF3302/PF11742_8/0_00082DUF3302/PF11742_8/4_9e03DUF3302/PF11742_8/8_2e03CCSMST1/PF15013_6/0_013FixQ/PF05545_11/0_048DPM2/PF07297_12/0_041HRG/PF16954_5/0_2_NODE_67_length_15652_cov_76_134937_g60_i01316813632